LSAVGALKRCELFLGLDNNALQRIADLSSCQEKVYQSQEIIFEEGEDAEHLYVLEEGRVNLVVKIPTGSSPLPEQTVVHTITKGGIFGWSALVPPHVFTMSAIAKEPSKVVAIGGNELRHLFDKDTHLGYEVMNSLIRVIGARVRNIEQLLIKGKKSPFFERIEKGR
jgi:CRP-like cAMP-binding protein